MLTEAPLASPSDVAVALNRFGLGARPDDEAPADPKSWLIAQFESYDANPAVFSGAQDSATLGDGYAEAMLEAKDAEGAAKMAARKAARQEAQALYRDEVDMRARAALETSTPFVERLVHFWSNHFAISAEKPQVTLIAGAFEREAIRPHVLGRFEDMLLAAERHPAMLFYLDQVRSIGPNSRFANRAAKRNAKRQLGINENLAREIMELHTLGARSGYSQADVTEFALALTGFSTGRTKGRGQAGAFTFRPGLHEPGQRTIMGKTYGQRGEKQALAVLGDLAAADATATHIATKLARHFIADEPPAAVVTRLAEAFRRSKGNPSRSTARSSTVQKPGNQRRRSSRRRGNGRSRRCAAWAAANSASRAWRNCSTNSANRYGGRVRRPAMTMLPGTGPRPMPWSAGSRRRSASPRRVGTSIREISRENSLPAHSAT